MKQGSTYMKIVVAILTVLVAAYFLFSILNSNGGGYTTYTAVAYKVGDGISTTGFVVRDEQVIESGESIVVLMRTDGERVGKGQVVANCYDSEQARKTQLEIEQKETELEQLEYAYSYSASDADAATLDADISQAIGQFSIYVNRRSLDFAEGTAAQLKSYILRRYASDDTADAIWTRITQTKDELNALYAQNSTASRSITAETAGYFGASVDGYETLLDSESIMSMTVSQFDAIADQRKPVTERQIGRLVTDIGWYYVTTVEAGAMDDYDKDDTLSVHFSHDFYGDARMTIKRIGEIEDGRQILVLKSNDYIQNAVSLREQSADIIFGYKDGLRIPKTALYVNEDGETGVYVLEGAEAEWKTVTPLYYGKDSVIVRQDQSSTDNLWPGDEVILSEDELFDGKVMIE